MNDKFEELRKLVLEDEILKADEILIEFRLRGDYEILEKLFELLRDDTEDDKLMFSILHTIETMDHHEYVKRYLNNLEMLTRQAPEWAGFMLIRIVNNELTYIILKTLISDHPEFSKLLSIAREKALLIKKDMPLL
jgi:hypothetical protein